MSALKQMWFDAAELSLLATVLRKVESDVESADGLDFQERAAVDALGKRARYIRRYCESQRDG